MSARNRLVKFYLRRFQRPMASRPQYRALQRGNLPHPPRGVAKAHVCQAITVDGTRAVWLDRHKIANGVLVYLHGGTYIAGPAKLQWQWFARLCRSTAVAGVLIDYRLTPQHAFPAALDDSLTIIRALQGQAAAAGARWSLAGDSAGGGLAVATCLRLRDLDEPLPAKLLLLSPWLDVTMSNPALRLTAEADPLLTFASAAHGAIPYVGHHDPRDPLISPLYGDLHGLPPMLVQVGTADLLLWDIRKFYLRCLDAGVCIQYEEYPELFHCFVLAGFLPESKRALRSEVAFLRS